MATPAPPTVNAAARPAWPRPVQWTLAFFLGAATTVLIARAASFHTSRPTERENAAPVQSVDLNRATKAELLQLPGVGEHLAESILSAREERGGFRQVDDLREVKGIGPMRLERIRPHVRVGTTTTTVVSGSLAEPSTDKNAARRSGSAKKNPSPNLRIDINRASAAELQQLPSVGPVLSQRIIDAREKTPFRSVDELRRVSGIGPKTLDKIRPFVTVGDAESNVSTKSE
ncbi:MAG TPA: helix-hairpin-helix domain-containing protein [Gemmataceae bacterium]|jgi:competence protein ComEA|nr:helix-hairpin-helix domain-containing protein [Gemmataceae bacterium]